jgi:N-methylhydantoinase B
MSARRARSAVDPIALAVLHHRLAAVADEMGVQLGRTGYSPNIKERHDYSCALFDARGRLAAQAAHIPVHLGSTPLSVRAALAACRPGRGDVVALNDPYAGGTHLPDVTLVAPVYRGARGALLGYVANRAHHADIGGMTPGSMPLAREIYQEGFRMPPVRLVRRGLVVPDVIGLFLANTRVPAERAGDLDAQRAALATGARRVAELADTLGEDELRTGMAALQDYTARLMRAAIAELKPGTYRARDVLDDDGIDRRPIPLRVAVTLGAGRAHVDFTGTSPQVEGSVNANYAITLSAVFYVFAALSREPIPANEGLLRHIRVDAPAGSVVNANFPAAVAGGNVETSQRIVDVLLRALAAAAPDRIPAASSGSMNNLAVGGFDRGRGRAFSYYETIAGGAGAGPRRAGASGVHTHMTNTFNTPIEALEAYYPMMITAYRLRPRSGGRGRHRGGDGLMREMRFLADAEVTLLTERRRIAPWGLAGGRDGARGRNQLLRDDRVEPLPSKVNLRVRAGWGVRVETPGGGGFGRLATKRKRRAGRRPSRSPQR